MELGCLGRFSGDSCEEILGISDAAATLRRLCREEVVLFALDQHGEGVAQVVNAMAGVQAGVTQRGLENALHAARSEVPPAVVHVSVRDKAYRQILDGGIETVDATHGGEKRRNPAIITCLLYTSPSPRDRTRSRMPSSA